MSARVHVREIEREDRRERDKRREMRRVLDLSKNMHRSPSGWKERLGTR